MSHAFDHNRKADQAGKELAESRENLERGLEVARKAVADMERAGTTAVVNLQLRVAAGRVAEVRFSIRDQEV